MHTAVISVLIDMDSPLPSRKNGAGQGYGAATIAALDHAAQTLSVQPHVRLVPTDTIDHRVIADPGAAVVVGPGSPYRNPEGVLEVIRSARENGIPLVGT